MSVPVFRPITILKCLTNSQNLFLILSKILEPKNLCTAQLIHPPKYLGQPHLMLCNFDKISDYESCESDECWLTLHRLREDLVQRSVYRPQINNSLLATPLVCFSNWSFSSYNIEDRCTSEWTLTLTAPVLVTTVTNPCMTMTHM